MLGSLRRGWRRESVLMWPLVQATAAATLAWQIALRLARHHDPFFAPIAAVVALNTTPGERGTHAFRLLFGVFIGIGVGEATIALLGSDIGSMALATFTAMSLARYIGGRRVMIGQAAASAILTVAVAGGQVGAQRLGDAVIGAGVALLFSQILFSPEPVALIRRAEAAALEEMAHLLTLTLRSLEKGETGIDPESIVASAGELRDRLGEVQRMRRAAGQVVRHSLYWRWRTEAVPRERTAACHLDLLGGSVLLLVRMARTGDSSQYGVLMPAVCELAEVIGSLAEAPDDHAKRQRALEKASRVARLEVEAPSPRISPLTGAILAARMVAADLIAFLGVDAARVQDAVHDETGSLEAPHVPPRHRVPFRR